MKIGEVAAIAGVNPSAIRHWEKEGLIRSMRNPENGYRAFTSRELKKIIVLSSLRKTVYFIESMKQLLEALETHDLAAIERSFKMALQRLDDQLKNQMERHIRNDEIYRRFAKKRRKLNTYKRAAFAL